MNMFNGFVYVCILHDIPRCRVHAVGSTRTFFFFWGGFFKLFGFSKMRLGSDMEGFNGFNGFNGITRNYGNLLEQKKRKNQQSPAGTGPFYRMWSSISLIVYSVFCMRTFFFFFFFFFFFSPSKPFGMLQHACTTTLLSPIIQLLLCITYYPSLLS